MDEQILFIPIQKVDAVRREVWGRGAQEMLDGAQEILDYGSSKPLFQKWSEDAYKRSGGKSKGNLRSMHKPIAAGKLIDINFNDDDRAIDIGCFVADDQEWEKVCQGVYTGFSVGGSYAKRWFDPSGGTRYTAKPTEISLVDAPCIPSAVFQMIKEDGSSELRKFTGAMEKATAEDIKNVPRSATGQWTAGGTSTAQAATVTPGGGSRGTPQPQQEPPRGGGGAKTPGGSSDQSRQKWTPQQRADWTASRPAGQRNRQKWTPEEQAAWHAAHPQGKAPGDKQPQKEPPKDNQPSLISPSAPAKPETPKVEPVKPVAPASPDSKAVKEPIKQPIEKPVEPRQAKVQKAMPPEVLGVESVVSPEVSTEVDPTDDQCAARISGSHGIEPAGISHANEPANWLDKFETVVREFSAGVERYDAVQKAEAAGKDKALKELRTRGSHVGIARREGEPMKPLAGFPDDPASYADPANWKFPCEKTLVANSLNFYNKGLTKSRYNPREWSVLGRRIASLASKSTGTLYAYSPEEKQIIRKEINPMLKLTKGTDVGSLLADLKAAMNGAVESIQSDPDKAQDLLMQALSAVEVASDVGTPASTEEESPHAVSGDPSSAKAISAPPEEFGSSPTPGSGPDKPKTPSMSGTPQTPQSSMSMDDMHKQLAALTDMVKQLAGSLKKEADPELPKVPVTNDPPSEIPAPEAGVKKNLPVGDLQGIVTKTDGQTDLFKTLTENPVMGLRKAIEKTGLKPDELQNMAQLEFIKALVDDGRISVKTHQVYQPPL